MDTRALVLDDELFLEELSWVRGLAQRLLSDPNDADDIVQEAWLRTRRTRVRFQSRNRLRAWLAAVARRMARDTLRARRRRAAREEHAARLEARQDAVDVVERSALLERLLLAVRALEEPQRSTVLLRYLDGYSTAEIASAMAVSEELVRKRLARTRAQLRLALGREAAAARTPGRFARAVQGAGLLVLLTLGLGGSRTPTAQAGVEGEGAWVHTQPAQARTEPVLVQRAPAAPAAERETISSDSSAEIRHVSESAAPTPASANPARTISVRD